MVVPDATAAPLVGADATATELTGPPDKFSGTALLVELAATVKLTGPATGADAAPTVMETVAGEDVPTLFVAV
jgi:hypothetical protein